MKRVICRDAALLAAGLIDTATGEVRSLSAERSAADALVVAAEAVMSAAHLRTHGFPDGDISDLDFSKMLPAMMTLDTALANLKEARK